MRRILKSVSSASSNHHHDQQPGGAGPASAPQKESPRLKGVGVSSRYAPELSKKNPTARINKKADASTSDNVNSPTLRGGGSAKRDQCPPAAENGLNYDTEQDGYGNTEGKEVEKAVITNPRKDPHWVSSRQSNHGHDSGVRNKHGLDLEEAFKSVVAGAMRRADCSILSVDKYPSKRSGLGAVDNVIQERTGAPRPAIKSRAGTPVATPPPTLETPRSTSAPKGRAISRDGPRMHSMRIPRVPDRVFEAAAAHSSEISRDLTSSTDNLTPRASRVAAYERQRLMNLPFVRTHGRAHSYSEGSGKPPPVSPSLVRKSIDSPRTGRKELGTPSAASGADAGNEKGPANKYAGARVVAERLAKAFRGTSKVKDGKNFADEDRNTALGQSKRMSGEKQQQHSADASYDASCSDTSVHPLNVRPDTRPGDAHLENSRKDAEEGHVLTWQEFVSDARAPRRLLNENPTLETYPDSSLLTKNVGATTDSRRWASSAQTDNNNSTPRPRQPSSQQEEKEREILKAWLEGLKRQSEGMNDDLEMKARMAEQRLTLLNGEQSLFDDQLDFLHELQINDGNGKSSLAAGINIMQQRIRRVHEEKKRLALEIASEVKRRITERAAAKEVLVMMKREMESCVRVMEKEKLGIQSGLERELERRENEWCSKLEHIKLQENHLRERVRRLEEEKGGALSELAAVASKESSSREKLRDFEQQVDGHRKREDGAEKTILDLRQSLVSSCEQARQAESDLDVVRNAYVEKENQNQELAKQVERLQQLCADHESSIEGLQQGLKNGVKISSELNGRTSDSVKKELVRLSVVEKSLREELEVQRCEMTALQWEKKALAERLGNVNQSEVASPDEILQAELASLHLRTTELQDQNNVLSLNVQAERDRGTEVLKTMESRLSDVGQKSKALQNEVERERSKVQEKDREIYRLERRVDGLLKNNQMLQGILAMREKAALISDEEAKEKEKTLKEAHQLEAEMRENLQVSARQLSFMTDRAELVNEKLKERDAQLAAVKNDHGKKDETIRNLEQSLGDLAKSVDAQNRRIKHLTNKNGELSRLLQTRGKEVEDLQSKIVEDSQSRTNCNQEMDQVSVQAHDVKQDLEAQNLLCKLLRDKLSQREDDLRKRCEEVTSLARSRDWLQAELKRTQSSFGETAQRLADLEISVKEKEEVMASLMAEKDEHMRNLSKLKAVLPRVEYERDEIQEEAEEIGREALRLSAEVEVLGRKVAELEEDVLVKEGQISILRGTSFGGSK